MQILSIQNVVDRLTQIAEQCKASQNKAGYFAALYKRMTIAVHDGINANQFEDGARMEKLDIVFAQRYLDAYSCFFSKQPCSNSWQFTFTACADNSLIVLQHLLLGINTHINLDLAIASAEVAPGESIYALQNDFNRINNLISSLIDDVQECLCEVWLPMRMLVKIANGKQIPVLNFSIDKAREVSWSNAVMLAKLNAEQKNIYIQQMDAVVKILGERIKSPDLATRFILEAIHVTEYDDVARTINIIDTTVVK